MPDGLSARPAPHETEVSLRGSSDEVDAELAREPTQRLQMVGIEVLEVRLSHLMVSNLPQPAPAALSRSSTPSRGESPVHELAFRPAIPGAESLHTLPGTPN